MHTSDSNNEHPLDSIGECRCGWPRWKPFHAEWSQLKVVATCDNEEDYKRLRKRSPKFVNDVALSVLKRGLDAKRKESGWTFKCMTAAQISAIQSDPHQDDCPLAKTEHRRKQEEASKSAPGRAQ